jgi:hypothetical protein
MMGETSSRDGLQPKGMIYVRQSKLVHFMCVCLNTLQGLYLCDSLCRCGETRHHANSRGAVCLSVHLSIRHLDHPVRHLNGGGWVSKGMAKTESGSSTLQMCKHRRFRAKGKGENWDRLSVCGMQSPFYLP